MRILYPGHMMTYLKGAPLPIEGELPLRMMGGAESSVMHFQLSRGDRLMLVPDDVAESTNANGRLVEFDRVNELLRSATTTAEETGAAQAFRHGSDSSVISVIHTAALKSAAASGSGLTAA